MDSGGGGGGGGGGNRRDVCLMSFSAKCTVTNTTTYRRRTERLTLTDLNGTIVNQIRDL